VVKVDGGQLFACSYHNPLHGGKEPLQNHPHCRLRHGLRHLHGVSPGKNRCGGCYTANRKCSRHCTIAACRQVKNRYYHTCDEFPCQRLKQLDKRYRTKYHLSMLDNLAAIKRDGIREFVNSEREHWACKACSGTIDIHHYRCSACGKEPE
jgi:hypothetical protein